MIQVGLRITPTGDVAIKIAPPALLWQNKLECVSHFAYGVAYSGST